MSRVKPTGLRSAWWLMAVACVLVAVGWSDHAEAACPTGDPCETINVYRLQSRLPISQDALGRPLVSLQEANATDATAFGPSAASTALAIRYQVTRIAINPNNYCECNLEYEDEGCPASTPLPRLRQCARVCRYADAACTATGFNTKSSGGKWYAFPAATQCGGIRTDWRKRTFGRTDPTWCDWLEEARIIKEASCLAEQLKQSPRPSLDALFDDDSVCPRLDESTL